MYESRMEDERQMMEDGPDRLPEKPMRYRIVLNIRHIGMVEDGRFTTHLKEMGQMQAYLNSWWNKPVTMGDHDEPMDWDDPVKVWYKLMGNLLKETSLRAVPLDPPPPGLPPDAPRLNERRDF